MGGLRHVVVLRLLRLLLLLLLLLGADEAKSPVREVEAAKDHDNCEDLWNNGLVD
jgi:hypothetical protein